MYINERQQMFLKAMSFYGLKEIPGEINNPQILKFFTEIGHRCEKYKVCTKCNNEKLFEEFGKDSRHKDGLKSRCKKCCTEDEKIYSVNNPDVAKEYRRRNINEIKKKEKKYRTKNAERIKRYRKIYYEEHKRVENEQCRKWKKLNHETIRNSTKKYRELNREKIKAYYRNRYKNNSNIKLRNYISKAISRSLKHGKRGRSWEDLVEYNVDDLKKHLESLFQDGMTWDNYGKWHIDHRIPVSIFNITGVNSKGFKKCWALENLQPLWAKDNLRKSNRLFV